MILISHITMKSISRRIRRFGPPPGDPPRIFLTPHSRFHANTRGGACKPKECPPPPARTSINPPIALHDQSNFTTTPPHALPLPQARRGSNTLLTQNSQSHFVLLASTSTLPTSLPPHRHLNNLRCSISARHSDGHGELYPNQT